MTISAVRTTSVAIEHQLQELIDQLHAKHVSLTAGQVATYIPELGKANPEHFGICVVTAEGDVMAAGDCDVPFTIQSISKPFTFGMALEDLGEDTVSRFVGVEPSGDAFNSIWLNGSTNRPYNPMVNTGAIAITPSSGFSIALARWPGDGCRSTSRSMNPNGAPVIAIAPSRICC